ncbi:MAG: IPT/TIG domain-containing protein [Treponema sp.]|jgi:transglutaminase-like putative cysteine protease|nr:IPT/TIG domain-containing protein [Treponema sp.]
MKIKRIKKSACLLILQLLLIYQLLITSCNSKIPVIKSIEPKIGKMGEVITLTGYNFGEERGGSNVTIAGIAPTNSSYQIWSDGIIRVRTPESGESGLVYVYAKGKKSNGVLFSNSAAVPRLPEGAEPGLRPQITSVSPQTGASGNTIIITGVNFGASRENSGVFFTWDYEPSSVNPFVVRDPQFIEVSDLEFGYDTWNAREIRVRIPDGAATGNLEVRTPRGKTHPVFFDISGKPGIKTYKDKRNYSISYSVDIKVLEAAKPNTLYLWMPRPAVSPSQRNISLVSRSVTPFVENYRGVSLYKLENLNSGSSQSVNISYNVEVYAVESGIRPLALKQNETSPFPAYTQSSNLIPADADIIKNLAAGITGREKNPYLTARLLYDWLITEMKVEESVLYTSAVTAAERKITNPCLMVLLYCSLMRACKIPCIPAAGVLVNRSGQTLRHYWAEFWLDGFGWVPVDPVMGARAVPDDYIIKQDWTNYYFGNIDSQRIAFSRGEINLSRIESRGRLVSHPQSYSLQNIWEEATGGLESYSSLWGDITITGIYVQ